MSWQNTLTGAAVFLVLFACGSTTGSVVDAGATTEAAYDSGLASGQCRVSGDCTSLGTAYYCGAQNLPPLCAGQCEPSTGGTCQADADCADAGAQSICSNVTARGPCYCSRGGAQPLPHCTKGCSLAADCGPGLTCDSKHRCVAATCAQPSDCDSANFACTSQQCAAKPCKQDGDCANFCVGGSCSAVIGGCNQAVP